jgi:multiple sugar transport system ATP-binding protein
MNLMPARLVEAGSSLALELSSGGRPGIQITLPAADPALAAYRNKEVISGIRPEAVSLARNGAALAPTERIVEARVEVIEPTGANTLAVLNLAGSEFSAVLDPDAQLTPGQDARFAVDLARLVCFDAATEQRIG